MEWFAQDVIVRRATERELPELLRIEEECFGMEKFSPDTVRAFASRNDAFVLLAIEADNIYGSAMCVISGEASEGKIASIAVLRRHRGKGVGALLLDACEKEFRARGLKRYSLEVETENEPAISLYLSRGYDAKGIIKDFYSAGRDAYCMEKKHDSNGRVLIKPS